MKKLLLVSSTSAYALSDGAQCNTCINGGKNHCWSYKPDGTGSWSTGYCCGPDDASCKNLKYCSSNVNSFDLKLFTCPVDSYRCPDKFISIKDKLATAYKEWD